MLIDWFTVVAQIANFLILVFLMKRFLYGPLIQAIDSREARIAAQVAEAEHKELEADRKTAEVRAQISGIESGCAQMIEDAHKDADHQRHELVQTARDAVQAMQTRWQADLDREEAVFFQEVRRTAAAEVLAITRRALTDLAGPDLERSAIQTFLEKLRTVDPAVLTTLCNGDLTVVSAHELPTDSRQRIEQTLETRVGRPQRLHFECAPEIAWGIELRGGGQRIGWTPDRYVDSLEEKLRTVLDQRAGISAPLAVG